MVAGTSTRVFLRSSYFSARYDASISVSLPSQKKRALLVANVPVKSSASASELLLWVVCQAQRGYRNRSWGEGGQKVNGAVTGKLQMPKQARVGKRWPEIRPLPSHASRGMRWAPRITRASSTPWHAGSHAGGCLYYFFIILIFFNSIKYYFNN